MWLSLTRQIFISLLLSLKFLLTVQKSYKVSDDYHNPIIIQLPKDILTTRHANRLTAGHLAKYRKQRHREESPHYPPHPGNGHESDSGHESHYSGHESSSHESSDDEHQHDHHSDHESSEEVGARRKRYRKQMKSSPRSMPRRKPRTRLQNSQYSPPISGQYHQPEMEQAYEVLDEPSEFEHLAQRINDPKGLLVKVYRGPTENREMKKPFASFGYYIKYPDSR